MLIRAHVPREVVPVNAENVVLESATPNPFNPITTIKYALPSRCQVSLRIYNMKGSLVATLVDGVMDAGEHSAVWDGRDFNGAAVATGAYLYQMQAGDTEIVKKMMLLK
jgi:flagellar hook assembly protein FlgD